MWLPDVHMVWVPKCGLPQGRAGPGSLKPYVKSRTTKPPWAHEYHPQKKRTPQVPSSRTSWRAPFWWCGYQINIWSGYRVCVSPRHNWTRCVNVFHTHMCCATRVNDMRNAFCHPQTIEVAWSSLRAKHVHTMRIIFVSQVGP